MILNLILNMLGLSIPEGGDAITKYAFGVLILSLIILLALINVLGYFFSLYLLSKYDNYISERLPKLRKIVGYYEKSSFVFILIEVLFCIGCLLFLIITALILKKKIYFKLSWFLKLSSFSIKG